MAHPSLPQPGSIVTYLNPDVLAPETFLTGVVLGAHVVDPETDRSWLSLLLPDRSTFVLDAANIVEVQPSGSAEP
ncbi:hypothetical protein [Saccharothrix xinjiangensis]|uniref:Uncharacterized protein n=1 Tax=Saccharothrix xinjiangensis TaxID=204798 RepID=A0ABV9Y4I3_9PSEU